MDESWDADFDGDLRIPEAVRHASDSVHSETRAARELSTVTAELKSRISKDYAEIPHSLLTHAVAIVQASTTEEDDELYSSEAWKLCKNENLEVAGDSIEEVLTYAKSILNSIEKEKPR